MTAKPAVQSFKQDRRLAADHPPRALRPAMVTGLIRLAGPKISAMFAATVPVGLLLGAIEVSTAYILYLVLARFHLVAGTDNRSGWLAGIDPLVLLAVVAILAAIMRYLAQTLPSIANSAFEARLRQALSDATLNSSGESSAFSVSEVAHIVNTLAPKAGGFLQGLMAALGAASLLALITAELVHLSWRLTAFSVIGAAVLSLPVLWLKRTSGRFSDRAYAFHRSFTHRFLKDVRNVHFLKLCGLNGIESDQLKQIACAVRDNARNYQLLYATGSNLPFLAGTALIVGLLWVNTGSELMPAAGLVPFIYLLNRVVGSVTAVSNSTGQLRENLPYARELIGYADTLFPLPAGDTTGGRVRPRLVALECRELAFGRRQPLTAPLSFAVRSGEMVLISGPSGCGKTTLLMTLLGLIPRLGGEISWGGQPIERVDAVDLRRRTAFAGPDPYLIDTDIRTNLLFGLGRSDVTSAEIDRALHIACAEFIHELKGGLDHELREHGDGVSAGQKQRLALARCILRRPEVLVLDEATANIDEDTEREFLERLLVACPQLMVIAVSHRSSLRKFATHFVEI